MTQDHAFNQFRVAEIVEIELDVEEGQDSVIRLFLRSRTGDQAALELPASMWVQVYEFLTAAMKQFPEGQHRH